ncbi:MAG: hypothetical protein WC467_03510 [Patescibacteria group bacterium]
MFDYLQQFNNLPKEIREKVSGPLVMSALAELEKKYQVDLAMAVMKVMIKSITVNNLAAYFISDFNLSQTAAENLVKDLVAQVFVGVSDYLGLGKQIKAYDLDTDINLIMSDAALVLPSSDLVGRFKSVLSTYLKGIRSKLAARDTMAKPINLGGLNLGAAEIDRVFKVCEQKTFKSLEVNLATVSKLPAPQTRLDKIIALADGAAGGEYNLKQALASGQIKKPEGAVPVPSKEQPKLDTSHEISAPEKELDLPLAPVAPATPVVPKMPVAPPKPVAPAAPVTPVAPATPVAQTTLAKPVARVVPVQTTPPVKSAVNDIPAQHIKKPEKKAGLFGFMNHKKAAIPVPPVVSVMPTSPIIPHPAPRPVAAARPIFAPSIAKQVMHDIKPMPKVMGPLEELQFLDLLNFRRLGKTPAEITAKIFSKVKLLEADGYDKMVAGVRAWRQSPVNRLYLKMVQTAMSKGMKLKDFALEAEKNNKDNLSLEEIEAILEMNSKLVF